MATHPANSQTVKHAPSLWLLLVTFSSAAYWVFRYGLWFIEGDGVRLTLAAEGILHEGTLVTTNWTYGNGYGYQGLLAALSLIADVPILTFQLVGGLWLTVVIAAAFLAYQKFLGGHRLAAAAAFLLLIQPDFIFYILRSSHEKTTWMYALLLLWLWLKIPSFGRIQTKAAAVICIYLLLWGMIVNNAYLGSTILTTFWIGALVATIFKVAMPARLPVGVDARFIQRLRFVPLTGTVLLFIFITFTYRPVIAYYGTLNSLVDRFVVVFIAGEDEILVEEPYCHLNPECKPVSTRRGPYIQKGWVSGTAYLMLTSPQWGVVLLSLAAWVRDLFRMRELTTSRWLLWLFYTGFITQLGLGVLIDLSGSLASNLQLRLFAPFALMSSPLAATWLTYLPQQAPKRFVRLCTIVAAVLAITFALFKASNEPLFANFWVYTSPREVAGVEWLETHVEDEFVWVDIWNHMKDALLLYNGYLWQRHNIYVVGNQDAPYILTSDLTTAQANRSPGIVLPSLIGRNRIYDNGTVQIYKIVP